MVVLCSDNRSSCLFRHQTLFSAPQHSVGLRIKRLTSLTSLAPRHVLQADRGRQDLPLPPSTTRVAPCTCCRTCWPSRCPTPFASTSTVLQTTCRRQWPVTSCTSTAGTPSLSTPSPATSPLTKSVPRRLATTPYKYRTTSAWKPSSSRLPTTVSRFCKSYLKLFSCYRPFQNSRFRMHATLRT